jgi:hypothetical protein
MLAIRRIIGIDKLWIQGELRRYDVECLHDFWARDENLRIMLTLDKLLIL